MTGTEASNDLPVHFIGSPEFFPSILSYIRNAAAPVQLPLDSVIIQSILLCIASGDKHLILRTPEEDVGLVVKLTVLTLIAIFDLRTHKVKIRPQLPVRKNSSSVIADPAIFLRTLFLPSVSALSNSNQTSQDEGSTDAHQPRHFRKYPQSGISRLQSQNTNNQWLNPLQYTRSFSFPNDLTQVTGVSETKDQESTDTYVIGTNESSRSQRTTHSSFHTTKAHARHPTFRHAYSEPLHYHQRESTLTPHKRRRQVPSALVVSGLENATLASQRSIVSVLSDKKIVLQAHNPGLYKKSDDGMETTDDNEEDNVWNLPEKFIMVYVCPWNPKERPNIHKSLLDKFSMSSNVFVAENTRDVFRSLPFSPSLPSSPQSYSNPSTPSPQTYTLPQTSTPPYFSRPLPSLSRRYLRPIHLPPRKILPASFLDFLRETCRRVHMSSDLSLYLSDLFSATRHHPQLDGTLLTVRATQDAHDLVRAGRVLGTDLTGAELIRPLMSSKLDSSDEYSQLDDWGEFDMNESSYQASNTTLPRNSVPVLDVSAVDIARIVPRVISHRLCVRDGPQDEVLASAVFGATFGIPKENPLQQGYDEDSRVTVKNILISIMATV